MERVELAYARHLLNRPNGYFAGTDWRGAFCALPRDAVAALLARPEASSARALRRNMRSPLAIAPGTVFSLVAHEGLHRGHAIAGLRAQGALFMPAVQDLIPLDLPDSTRWLQRVMTRIRLAQVGRLADGVLLSTEAVRASLARRLGAAMPPSLVAPLGLDLPPATAPPGGHFLCIATIERRKNHAMLLKAWRRLGSTAPPLILVGRRSFGAGEALALLDSGALPMVQERGHCPDAELASLLAGARALLLPSQAEGFGLPLAEALAAGVPVIASDIPALREIGRGVPEHLPADDPTAWASMVRAYAAPTSPARAAQFARIRGWRAPSWPAHFHKVESFLHALVPRA